MLKKLTKLNKEFDTKILIKAKKITEKYEIILTQDDGEWYGNSIEMPNIFGDGKTPKECKKNTKEAITTVIAYLLEQKEIIPTPTNKEKRTEQINISLTYEEKNNLSAKASSHGYKNIADYIRAEVFTHQIA